MNEPNDTHDAEEPAARDEQLYDRYLDAALRGEIEDPEAFVQRQGGGSEVLRERLSAVWAMVRGEATHGGASQNVVAAASVVRNRRLTPAADARAVVVNSGNANACTGERGRDDDERMAAWTAEACGVRPEQVLTLSTGVIGQYLLHDLEPGVFVAVQQYRDKQEPRIPAIELNQGWIGKQTADICGGDVEKSVGQAMQPVKLFDHVPGSRHRCQRKGEAESKAAASHQSFTLRPGRNQSAA